MLCLYRFGGYRFQIHSDFDIAPLLPAYWEQYRLSPEDGLDAYCIQLLPGLDETTLNRHDHWAYERQDGQFRAVFFQRRRGVFAIRSSADDRSLTLELCGTDRALLLGLHHAMMFLVSGQCLGLHCAVLICRDQAIALSAPSGTGKTTLSRMLMRYGDAALVNGDFAMLSLSQSGQVVFEPTPFCGSSGVCAPVRLPLSRIVFLEQAPHHRTVPLTVPQAMQRLLSNAFIPMADPDQVNRIHSLAAAITAAIPMELFSFALDQGAASTFYRDLIL